LIGGNRLSRNTLILMSREEHRYQLGWHESYLAAGDRVTFVMGSSLDIP
jgi:hypothetical protein